MKTSPWGTPRFLAAVLLASGLLKLALAVAVRHHDAILDEGAYLELAQGLAAGRGFAGTFRPPGYPAFMAFWLWLGAGTLGIRLVQVALSLASTVLLHRIVAREAGERAARVAVLVFAFDPLLVAFSHRLWSETLFIALFLVALDQLLLVAREPGWRRVALTGLVLGASALVRPMVVTSLPFIGVWFLWNAWRDRGADGLRLARPVLQTLGLGLACLLVILPWTARNQRVTGTFILIDSNGPFNFLVGSQPEARFVDKDDVWSSRYGRVDGQPYTELVLTDAARAQGGAMAQAKVNIAADPAAFLAKCLWEAGHLWTLDSFLLRHLRNGWYGQGLPGWVTPLVTVASAGFYALLVLAGLAGLLLDSRPPLSRLAVLLVGQTVLLFGATYALSRYSLTLHPLLAFGAAALLTATGGPLERWRSAARPARAALVLLLVLVGSGWVRDVPLLGDMLLRQGAAHRFRMEQAGGPQP
ncbi:MAG: glycosyltransferase family 39 protein [Gemmatimonadales bacterium]|nr:glycosyltransferase family 39 protein [Gemmatimonadales bacterium]